MNRVSTGSLVTYLAPSHYLNQCWNYNQSTKLFFSFTKMHLKNVIWVILSRGRWINPLRPRENGRHFADDTFKCIFLNEDVRISIKISLKFVPKGPINNIPALVQIMAWCGPGDKPLSEPMVVRLPTHICVTRPQWVKACGAFTECQPQLHHSSLFHFAAAVFRNHVDSAP